MSSRRSFSTPRRIPPPAMSQGGGSTIYAQVPTSPGSSIAHQHASRSYNPPYPPNRSTPSSIGDHGPADPATARGVAAGTIGSAYGPYAYSQEGGQNTYSPAATRSRFSQVATTEQSHNSTEKGPRTATTTVPPFLWDSKDPDLDDPLHSYDPERDALADREWTIFSLRGWLNGLTLFVIAFGIIVLFAGYPIISALTKQGDKLPGFNLGGTNATGQVPDLPNLPDLIDKDTPADKRYWTGTDGSSYRLVFSDEFNTDGRTFYPGDDPFWEAVDFHYWPTADIEWYDPAQATTKGGNLVLTMQEVQNHRMNFRSGMIQSWNKFCFTGGYIEVSISLPGTSQTPGFWPGAWTMGNLGRPGYGATTDGTWPYSYDVCDLGTLANQTLSPGNPPAASTMGDPNYGNSLSYLPGQRLSACTCPGEDHPGPPGKGRGAPEIDILEAQIELGDVRRGVASQSFQMAPFNAHYEFNDNPPNVEIYDPLNTKFNTYKGSIYQQAASALTYIDSNNYNGQGFGTYGFEYWPGRDKDSHITWTVDGKKAWSLYPGAVGADTTAQIGPRTIAEEPMTIILNFGMSPGFQPQDFNVLPFPSQMLVDYVRVYQKEGWENIGCDPDGFPTTAYIASHPEAYGNWNWTTWASAGYSFPKSSAKGDC